MSNDIDLNGNPRSMGRLKRTFHDCCTVIGVGGEYLGKFELPQGCSRYMEQVVLEQNLVLSQGEEDGTKAKDMPGLPVLRSGDG